MREWQEERKERADGTLYFTGGWLYSDLHTKITTVMA